MSWWEPKWRSTRLADRRPGRRQRVGVEAARAARARPSTSTRRRRDRRRSGTYSTRLVADAAARTISPVTLLTQVVVGRDLAADDRQPEAPAGVDRDHARVAAERVAGEHHAGDRGVDHQLHGHAHRRRRRTPKRGAVADRLGRCRGSPSSRGPRRRPRRRPAPTGRSPAGRRRWPPRCPRPARSSAPRPATSPSRQWPAIDLLADGVRALSACPDQLAPAIASASLDRRRASRSRAAPGTPGRRRSTARTRAAPGSPPPAARRGSRSCRRSGRRSPRSECSGCCRPRPLTASLVAEQRDHARRAVDPDHLAGADLRRWRGRCRRPPAARTRGRRSRRATSRRRRR